ncbi:MAG TPA: hypothetical protein PLP19_06495 [bacterium]|nr:hypothetical protein [bacterium]HPN43118.1 hypothetical protein [bacterium]
MKQVLALLIVLLLLSCTSEEKPRLASDQIQLGTEVLKTYITLSAQDTTAVHSEAQLFDSSLKMHNMTREEFNRIVDYFKNNPDRINDELTEINEHIDQLKLD